MAKVIDAGEARSRRAANLAEVARAAPPVARGVIERVVGFTPVPKQPADRLQAMRDLAMGEECQVRYTPVCRHPSTDHTVGCHTNTQADQKGMGYKAHDSAIFFGCDRCHEAIDRRLLSPIQTEELVRAAGERTRIRLRFIANSITERPWRVRTARWALEQIESRKEKP